MCCSNCFHYNVCGNASPHNDVSMCKQFLPPDKVLSGSALKVVLEEFEKMKELNQRKDKDLKHYKLANQELEREVMLLTIIKQTLEMQSGMKFDI